MVCHDVFDMFVSGRIVFVWQLVSERLVGKLFEDESGVGDGSAASPAVPMVSPDMGFVNMLRYGILALQLLPENSSAGRYRETTPAQVRAVLGRQQQSR